MLKVVNLLGIVLKRDIKIELLDKAMVVALAWMQEKTKCAIS